MIFEMFCQIRPGSNVSAMDEYRASSSDTVLSRGVATGWGISVYILPPKSVYVKFFMWLFCLLDPGQIRYRAHPNQIPGDASGLLSCIFF